jgi:Rad3-related DNA helicase
MHKCLFAGRCEYLLKKEQAKASSFTALSYAYFLAAKWPAEDNRSYVYLDEAHNLAKVTLDWAGCRITGKDVADWQLPDLPLIEHRAPNILLRLPLPTDLALTWLVDARQVMANWWR